MQDESSCSRVRGESVTQWLTVCTTGTYLSVSVHFIASAASTDALDDHDSAYEEDSEGTDVKERSQIVYVLDKWCKCTRWTSDVWIISRYCSIPPAMLQERQFTWITEMYDRLRQDTSIRRVQRERYSEALLSKKVFHLHEVTIALNLILDGHWFAEKSVLAFFRSLDAFAIIERTETQTQTKTSTVKRQLSVEKAVIKRSIERVTKLHSIYASYLVEWTKTDGLIDSIVLHMREWVE